MDELARTKSLLEHLNVGVQKYLGMCKHSDGPDKWEKVLKRQVDS